MKQLQLTVILGLLSTSAIAQPMQLSTSPIPDNAETRFCYYAGLAYSENSYVVLTGSNTVTDTTRNVEERLLRCIKRDDGKLGWKPESTMQMGR